MKSAREIPVLDVRAREAFLAGHWPGAVNVPLAELARRMQELPPKGRRLRVFGVDEGLQAAELLRARGYQVEVISFAVQALSETGPAKGRLWEPSPFLVEAWEQVRTHLPERPRVVDLGCGSGREAVYLAMQGCEVTAVDVLPDALAKAKALAASAGVGIRTLCRDLVRGTRQGDKETWGQGGGEKAWDLILLFRFVHRPLIRVIPDLLNPGGFAVIEGFHERDGTGESGRKREKLLQEGELAGLMAGMKTVMSRDGVEREGRWFCQWVGCKADLR